MCQVKPDLRTDCFKKATSTIHNRRQHCYLIAAILHTFSHILYEPHAPDFSSLDLRRDLTDGFTVAFDLAFSTVSQPITINQNLCIRLVRAAAAVPSLDPIAAFISRLLYCRLLMGPTSSCSILDRALIEYYDAVPHAFEEPLSFPTTLATLLNESWPGDGSAADLIVSKYQWQLQSR